MSTLDQAFIKAYTKDRPAAAPMPVPPEPKGTPVAGRSAARSVEQAYRDGTLYRVDSPQSVATEPAPVPTPHVRLLPPTSPRRAVRRSVLKLLASQVGGQSVAARLPALPAAPATPRIARKVIIRHIPHAVVPAPHDAPISPPATTPVTRPLAATARTWPYSDVPPESAPQPVPGRSLNVNMRPSQSALPLPSPADHRAASLPAEAAPAPAWDFASSSAPGVEVRGAWKDPSAVAPLVVLSEPCDVSAASETMLVALQLESLPAAAEAVDEPELAARLDSPHARGAARPHVRFDSPRPEKPKRASAEENPATTSAEQAKAVASELPAHEALEPEEIRSLLGSEEAEVEAEVIETPCESPKAEQEKRAAADEASVADTTTTSSAAEDVSEQSAKPDEQRDPAAAAKEQPDIAQATPRSEAAAPAKQATLPLQAQWEVDRFHWPKACERLLADKGGYFAQAGERLRAATDDGLRILAITGSRRGEGRTTLALCLARAAADAGLDVAIIDGDFARPQLAGKVGVEAAFGWQDAAVGKIPLSEAAVKSLNDNITVLPLEGSSARSRLSLADPRVTAVLRQTAAAFDLVILDLGPMASGDALAFPPGEACPLDAAIVVRDLRFATAAESDAVGQALYDAGIEAVGVAENFVVEEQPALTA